ncbi:MAG: Nif3-like dinuclear metal center hexameric protein [Bacteroidales bacterium]|nr:Nif3-like dinuclear metal center hexameric protein [Bacteroidales bacterium]
MKIREVTDYLNSRFLPSYQESYDNAGLLLGDVDQEVSSVLVTIDVTPAVVDEAVERRCNLIVSHHPLIFGGLKRITPDNATGDMVMRLITNKIAVYAAHTNLDNLDWGVNAALARHLGLEHCRILRPMEGVLRKLVTYVPTAQADAVRTALFNAGAGCIGAYDCCSYNNDGFGTFRANEGCNPFCGNIGELHREEETRIEVIYEKRLERKLIAQLIKAHPYEEPAYDCMPLANAYARVGAGMIGTLAHPVDTRTFLESVKERLGLPTVRCSELCKEQVGRVAICGGAGSFLIGDAKAHGADIYLTADLKYHDFQQAEESIVLADIGHYHSEQYAKEIFYDVISEKFSTFACLKAESDKGYIRYI